MKAKFFEFNGQMEIVLENGNVIAANESEAKVDFLNRVTEEVDAEFMENLEVTEVTASNLKKKASKALVASFEKATGVEAELIKSVLESRGVPVGESTEEAAAEEETVEAPKKEKKAKAVKEPKEKISLSDALDKAKEMRVNVGKVIEFSSFRKGETITAEIKQVVVDTRVNRIYFRVHELSTGKLYHTSIYNSSVVINEEETARVAEERAAAQRAKEEEKAKKKSKKKAEVETAEEIQD